MTPTLGLALIARDEQDTLPRLLASVAGAFDEVVLCDTGSRDGTVRVFTDWAKCEGVRWRLVRHRWRDDFAAARNKSFAALTTDWCAWADCDDAIENADALRSVVASIPRETVALTCEYVDANGLRAWRDRVLRRGASTWFGRVHEIPMHDGPTLMVPGDVCRWLHDKPTERMGSPRNLRILRSWVADKPDDPHVLWLLIHELHGCDDNEGALPYCERLAALDLPWTVDRGQFHRTYALCLKEAGHIDAALGVAAEAVAELPEWPGGYVTLAECLLRADEPVGAIGAALMTMERADEMTAEDLANDRELDFTVRPRMVMAEAYRDLGDLDAATYWMEDALATMREAGVSMAEADR